MRSFSFAVKDVTAAFTGFQEVIHARSTFLKTLEKEKSDTVSRFTAELETIFNQALITYKPDGLLRLSISFIRIIFSKSLPEKSERLSIIFSALFSYSDYLDLLAKADFEKTVLYYFWCD